jgi:16S rRNA (guanine527-N7)-methyltransferase
MTGGNIEALVESALRRAGTLAMELESRERLVEYAKQVDSWSERVHLVGKGRQGANLGLLVLDSLLLLGLAEEWGLRMRKVADIGSGAGFPGVVWKIVRPGLGVTLFERKTKPQLFLERIVAGLGLDGVEVFGGDAAGYAGPEAFDIVVSKAAGRLGEILPLAERLLGPHGAYLTVKGRSWESEVRDAPKGAMQFESARELPERRGAALLFRKGHALP